MRPTHPKTDMIWRVGLFCFVFYGLILLQSPLWANNYIVDFKGAMIDWSNGIVEATGVGVPSVSYPEKAQARAMAKSESLAAARSKLVEIVAGIRVDADTLIKDLLVQDDAVKARIQRASQTSQPVETSYKDDGRVQTTVSLKISEVLRDLILPASIKAIHSVQQPKRHNQHKEDTYTGLVVNGLGCKVEPAVAPRIVDEDGNTVYGPAYVSRKHAVQIGMVVYLRDLSKALVNDRVGEKPLMVKGIRASKEAPCDIVISNADAALVRSSPSNLLFLQECRVIIVLD